MKKIFYNAFIGLVLFQTGLMTAQQSNCVITPSPVEETYHGVKVMDEYRNLENTKSEEFVNWINCQNEFTKNSLNRLKAKDSLSKTFYDRLKENKDMSYGFSFKKNNNYFYYKRFQNESYSKLYRKQGNEKEVIVFDPKTYKPESGKQFLINYFKLNHGENKIAIGLTEGGREISEIVIFDLVTKQLLPETIVNTWPSELGGISCLKDDSGFLFTKMTTSDNKDPNFLFDTAFCLHKLNSNETDRVIFSRGNNPEIKINKEDFPIVSIEQNYLAGYIGGATSFSDTYFASVDDLKKEKITWNPLFQKEDKVSSFLFRDNQVFYVINSKEVYKKNLITNGVATPVLLFKAKKDEFINHLVQTKEGLYYTTLQNGIDAHFYFYDFKKSIELKLPFKTGTINIDTIDEQNSELWAFCSGWTQKTRIFKFDVKQKTFTEEKFNTYTSKYNDIVVDEIEIKTHDGLLMPVSILYSKEMKKNGANRTIIDAYGAYGSIDSPGYYANALEWVYKGGIYVTPHVRGGGEKGEEWHLGGFKQTKPNTWKDVVSTAEFLIKEKFTSSNHLGVVGVSAGGVTMGRAITYRPDLFKAAVIKVGMVNALRSEFSPNGLNNVKEFGTVTIEEEFKALYEMDAYHHVFPNTKYPATLITAGMNDPRVIVWQPAKFAAKLQACQANPDNPILLRTEMEGGHGGNVTVNKSVDESVDVFSFFYWQLGHPDFQIKK